MPVTSLHAHPSPLPHPLPHPIAGFSGADLANVVNEAAFLAARTSTEAVGLPELVEAVQRTRYGVNGGLGGGLGGGMLLSQRLRGWLVDAISSGKAVRSSPYGS